MADIDTLLLQAQNQLAAQNYAGVEAACRQILARQPNHADALGLMGVVEAQSWNHPQAIEFFRKAWEQAPDNTAHGYNLSLSLKVLGKHDEAESILRQLLSIFPDHPHTSRELAALCAVRGNFEEAQQLLEAFIQRQPDQFHTIQAPYLETLTQQIYQHATTLDTESIFPLIHRMLAHGFTQEARAALDFILEVSPGHPLALEQVADLLLAEGKTWESAAAYLALPTMDGPLLDKLALALKKSGGPHHILLLNPPDGAGHRLITDVSGLEEEAYRLSRHSHQRWMGEAYLLRGLRHAFNGDVELAGILLDKWQKAVPTTHATIPQPGGPGFLLYVDFSPEQPDDPQAKGRLLLAMAGASRHLPRVSACFTLAHARRIGIEEDYLRSREILAYLASLPGEAAAKPAPAPLHDSRVSTLARLTADPRQQELAARLHQAQLAHFYYTIDIVGACNLKCASCANGNMDPSLQKHGLMSLDTFHQIVEKIRRERKGAEIRIDLYNWGEPCQHPQLPEFISVVKEAGYKCGLSCNLNRAKNVEGLIAAGPDFIRISLSGYTQAVYEQTHNGGNIASVIANLRKLREAIDRHGASTVVQVGYLLYRHNCGDDLDRMKQLCDELDFLFAPAPAMLMPLEKHLDASDGHVAPDDRTLVDKLLLSPLEMRAFAMPFRSRHTGCALRQGNLSINFDGSVPLCCAVYDKKYDIVPHYLDAPEQAIQSQRDTHPLCTMCTAHTSDFVYNGIRFPGLMDTVSARVDRLHEGAKVASTDYGGSFHAMMGLIHQFQGEHEASLSELGKAVAVDPGAPDLWFRLAKAHKDGGHYASSIRAFQQALQIRPDFPDCQLELGKVHRLAGNVQQAIQAYEAYLASRPNHGRALYNLGILHQINGDHDQALEHFRKCLEASPYFLTCLGRLRDYEEIRQEPFRLSDDPHLFFFDQGKQQGTQKNLPEALLFLALASSLAPGWNEPRKEICRLLEPLGASRVKFSFLVHTHIGHLAANTDLFLRNRALGKTADDTVHIFLSPGSPANRQLLKMIKRQLPVIESSHLFYLASEFLDKSYQHPLIITGNEYFEYRYASSTFSFIEEEESLGRKYLESKGLDTETQWFICIFARDPVYSSTLCEKQQADSLSFRNADIDSYHPAIRHILDKGGFVFRIGSHVEKPLGLRHPRVIDYALEDRTDFLDIYLIAKCRFIMGSNSGICDAARVFDTPYLGVNTTPLDWKPYGRGDLFIPKKIRDTLTGQFLTLKEFFARNGINGTALWSDAALKANHLAYVPNTEEEILAITKEMIERLDGLHQATLEDEMSQERYHQAFQQNQTAFPVRTPIGREFIRENLYLCE